MGKVACILILFKIQFGITGYRCIVVGVYLALIFLYLLAVKKSCVIALMFKPLKFQLGIKRIL